MKLIISIVALSVSFSLQAQSTSREEQMLESLKQAGIVRQEGKTIIYKVQKASDTAKVRLLYGNLFNNPNYNVRFEIAEQKNAKTSTNSKTVPANNLPAVSTNAVSQNAVNQSAGNCCFCNIKTFQYVGVGSDRSATNPFTQHTWTVPAGVTKIKLEAWSAGGNGWSDIYINANSTYGTDTVYAVKGGGGGGGAYVLSFVSVKAGDVLKIRIPGGGSGSPLIVQFAQTGIGTLNIESGHNAKPGFGSSLYDGVAGRLDMNSGLFSENTFSLRGENGQHAWLSDYVNKDNVTPGPAGPLMAPRLKLGDSYSVIGGDGGMAPKSVHGGRGLNWGRPYVSDIVATDGGYPGGGGGAGFREPLTPPQPEWKNGIGAAGLLIIYY